MRAKYVYESLSFERGMDPKEALGLGVSPLNYKAYSRYFISKIPEILGTSSIPSDITEGRFVYFNWKYYSDIQNFISASLKKFGIEHLLDREGNLISIQNDIHKVDALYRVILADLSDLGFSNNLI
jgi:hypothetical protein